MRWERLGRSATRVSPVTFSCALAVLIATPGLAQNEAQLGGGTVTGIATVNVAAGNNNQQLNVGTIIAGDSALTGQAASQHIQGSTGSSGQATTQLDPNAFANSSGWIAVNGVSGNENQQANLAAFAIGANFGVAGDALLSQTRASQGPTGGPTAPNTDSQHSVGIGEGALGGSQGLVQVNLIGGDRNTSANTFAMSVSGLANQ